MKQDSNDKFIEIQEFAMRVGVSKPNLNKQSLLQSAINDLQNNKIITFYGERNNLYFNKKQVELFLSNIISFNNVINIANISRQTLRKLIKKHNIKHYIFGPTYDQRFLPKNAMRNYIYDENLINGLEFIKKMGLTKNYKSKNYSLLTKRVMGRIRSNHDLSLLLGYKKLEHPLYFKESNTPHHEVFNKQKIIDFIDNHISIKVLMQEFNISRSNLHTLLKSKNITVYAFQNRSEFQFISFEDYDFIKGYRYLVESGVNYSFLQNNEFVKMKLENNNYTNNEVIDKLKLKSDHNLNEILLTYKILPKKTIEFTDKNVNFYSKKDIHLLMQIQQELKVHYSENYYTLTQIGEKYKEFNHKGIIYQSNIEATECPLILRAILGTSVLYKKNEVENLFKMRQRDKMMLDVELDSPYDEFVYKTEEIQKASFSPNARETKKLWYQYVKYKMVNSTLKSSQRYINQYSRLSYLLSKALEKELYQYSTTSLNNIFFNERSETFNISHQIILYDFYIQLIGSLEKKIGKAFFQTNLVNNPNNFTKKRIVDTSRYSFEEYRKLYNYATDLTIHKDKAIKDVKSFLCGDPYIKYDSYWVYVLTHLTNNWRHSTIITEIPSIDLSNTKIRDLNWLSENNLSMEDANSIIFQIGLSLKSISKTGAKTEFRIAEQLKIPFATAVSICQLRLNLIGETKPNRQLLNLSKTNVVKSHYSLHQEFFNDFIPGFKFSNRKMNKTLTTLIWSVFKELNVAQVSRSHFNESSTLDYIKLSKQQINSIVHKLFANDTFGYINQLLKQSLFSDSKYLKPEGTLAIKKYFGDVQKIEISTGLLNKLAEEQKDITTLVNGLSSEEKHEIILKSMTNTLYSKQKYYQCVFSECKFKEQSISLQDCSNCSYSIINVYALTNLMNLYLNKINKLIDTFENSKAGEKQKMANQFYLLWRQIQNAKQIFGDSIYEFVDGGKERFSELSHKLPKTKSYLTIQK